MPLAGFLTTNAQREQEHRFPASEGPADRSARLIIPKSLKEA